ncbi:MAG TPA: gamma-glutamyl-gamma-aminobutyrate hydrolase family protein [Acidimicrobiales bacterium]|nr:gamma-glutamyl-gamma-aminobutyrate hydrolase family protein [Acidimicrobiales bacterium]
MSSSRPLVAVTSRRIPAERIDHWLEPAQALPTYYLDAIHEAGGIGASVIYQDPDAVDVDAFLARFDALMVTGGLDVDPALYGQEPHPETGGFDTTSDRWEIALIDAARRVEMPVLAICRGQQLLNVAQGGTLHQHLGELPGVGSHGIPDGGGGTPNAMSVEPDSRLAEAIGTEDVVGRCHHHQAVDEVGADLVVTARTADGVIEGLEIPDDRWTVAVQWHPEDSARNDPIQQRLFEAFVRAVPAANN